MQDRPLAKIKKGAKNGVFLERVGFQNFSIALHRDDLRDWVLKL
jgi:hypothetical protein